MNRFVAKCEKQNFCYPSIEINAWPLFAVLIGLWASEGSSSKPFVTDEYLPRSFLNAVHGLLFSPCLQASAYAQWTWPSDKFQEDDAVNDLEVLSKENTFWFNYAVVILKASIYGWVLLSSVCIRIRRCQVFIANTATTVNIGIGVNTVMTNGAI